MMIARAGLLSVLLLSIFTSVFFISLSLECMVLRVSAAFVVFLAEDCTSLDDVTLADGMILSSTLTSDKGCVSCDSRNLFLLSSSLAESSASLSFAMRMA